MKKSVLLAYRRRAGINFAIIFFLLSVPTLARSTEFFCSDVTCLIAAINEANTIANADIINLEPGSYTLTSIDNRPQFGANGLPVVTSEITINGVDAATTTIERDPGAPQFRIFDVAANGTLTLNGLTVKGGLIVSPGGAIQNAGTLNVSHSIIERNLSQGGGGIYNDGALSLTHSILALNTAQEGGAILNIGTGTGVIRHVTIIDNFATGGGGISNFGMMSIQNSTVYSNAADGAGGIFNRGTMEIKNTTVASNFIRFFSGAGVSNSGTLRITNSTITGNMAGSPGASAVPNGGGIANFTALELQNSIVALNTVNSLNPNAAPDCSGPITSLDNNIVGDLTGCDIDLAAGDLVTDPGLGDFVDDDMPGGGHFPLLKISPAIDRGNNEVCSADPVLNTDQLGQSRVGPCDIGAVEFQGPVTVAIDIKPRFDPNRINPSSTKTINVAIFSVDGFDATTIDRTTVRFGATGIEAAPINVVLRDRNRDGRRDLILRFKIQDTGIKCGDTSASITGQISSGRSISGSNPITTVQCKRKQ